MAVGRGKVVYRSRDVTVRFEMDYKGIAALALGPRLAAVVFDVASRKAMPYAISVSPRSDRRRDGDNRAHYQDSFRVVPLVTGAPPAREIIGKPPMWRVGARLINVSPHAAAVEWGNRGRRGHRVLGKTLDHLHGIGRDD